MAKKFGVGKSLGQLINLLDETAGSWEDGVEVYDQNAAAPLEHWDGWITFVHVESFLSSGGPPGDNYLLI